MIHSDISISKIAKACLSNPIQNPLCPKPGPTPTNYVPVPMVQKPQLVPMFIEMKHLIDI